MLDRIHALLSTTRRRLGEPVICDAERLSQAIEACKQAYHWTILDAPRVESVLIEEPEPGVPFGLKGVGEPSTIVSTAAIVAALRDATGRELNRAPVRPDDLAGVRGPAASNGPPPSPVVPGQQPIPEYHGMGLGQQQLMKGDA